MAALEAETVERFDTDGYVVTPGLLPVGEMERYGRAIDRAVTKRIAGDGRTVDEKSGYEQSFIQCMRLWETDPEVAPLTFDRRLAEAAAQLLRVDRVRLWQDQALYKEPGGRITDPHQDATFWPIGDTPLISAWIPLDGSTIDGGAMGYVPGSHRLGHLRTVNLLETSDAYEILADPALEGRLPVYVEAPKGTVVWHHGLTVHAAKANRTPATRRAFTIVYIADGHRRAKPWPSFPLDRAGVGVGEPMEGEGLPLLWPRADDTIPAPPPIIGEPTGPQVKTEPARP